MNTTNYVDKSWKDEFGCIIELYESYIVKNKSRPDIIHMTDAKFNRLMKAGPGLIDGHNVFGLKIKFVNSGLKVTKSRK